MLVGTAMALACGGRLIENRDGDDGTAGTDPSGGSSTSQGGSAATGARPSKGGASSFAGASVMGGGPQVGGSVGSGGACMCGPIACAPGFQPVPIPGNCCFTCEPVGCTGLPCPGVGCGPGSHPEILPGQCCPSCVPDSCQAQHDNYEVFRRQLFEKYSYGCMVNQDCAVYYEKNQCGYGCG